jgi:DNA primase
MGLIPETVIEEVLGRADIVDTVRHYVSLEQAGKNWKGLCPFHDDHDPSLKVHPGKQIYKCFACGAGGNAIKFLMEIEGWSFPEAVEHLADRHGVEMPDQDPEERERARERRERKKAYFRIMELAGDFFGSNLWDEQAGSEARAYLEQRGIDDETAREFGLGYAPDGWEHLLGHLHDHDVDGEQAEAAGLALARNNSPGHYDRFRDRIVFPVVDIWNKIRAFGGRTLKDDDDTPKYMNSPETPFYTKGEELYGLHVAKKYFQHTDFALLVEGNFDVIALHAAGFRTAVAPMGTALTERQAELLARYTTRVVVAFDGDQAGKKATEECMPALREAGLDGRVIRFDDDDDPDSFIRREGKVALRAKIDDADPIVGWAIDNVLVDDTEPVENRVAALEEAADILVEVEDDVIWNHYAGEISRRLSIEPEMLQKYLRRPDTSENEVREAVAESTQPLELDPAEASLFAVLMDHPDWIEHFVESDYEIMLASQELADLIHRLHDHYQDHDGVQTALFLEQIDEPTLNETVVELMDDPARDGSNDLSFYQDCVRTIQRKYAERGIRDIESQIDELSFEHDREKLKQLNDQLKKFMQLKNESVDTPPANH